MLAGVVVVDRAELVEEGAEAEEEAARVRLRRQELGTSLRHVQQFQHNDAEERRGAEGGEHRAPLDPLPHREQQQHDERPED
jgi:hypothetical protein